VPGVGDFRSFFLVSGLIFVSGEVVDMVVVSM
jgi:hypothetical protein